MSLISDLVERILTPILDKIKQLLGPFGKLFDLLGKFWNNVVSIGSKIQELVDAIKGEISAWRNFRENIAFRTRVINLPKALDHIQDFFAEIKAAYNSVLDLIEQIKSKLQVKTPAAEAEEAVADLEGSGLKSLIEKFPKLAKGLEKLLGWLALLVDALETVIATLDDLITIVGALRAIRENIEHADAVFLPNSNPRKTVKLADGTSMKIRVGKLHS
jgi:prophage DNA circulation protein